MPPHRSRARGGHHRAGAGGGDRPNGSWVRRGRRTGRTCVPSCPGADLDAYAALAALNTGIDVPGVALADVRGPPRGAMGRGGGHPGRPGPAMTQDGPPSVHVSARPVRALSPSGCHRAERRARSRGADPPGAAVTRCDREPLLPVIHTLCTCPQATLDLTPRVRLPLRLCSSLSSCAPGSTVHLPDPGSSAPPSTETRSPGSGPQRPRSMTHA